MASLTTWCFAGTTTLLAGVLAWTMRGESAPEARPGGSVASVGSFGSVGSDLSSAAITAIPTADDLDPRKVALGDRLFHDVRLSRDSSISCATCHDLAQGGADGARYSTGVDGAIGDINTPTVLNSRFQFHLFWDGRATSLEEQIDGPLHSPTEMASDWAEVLRRIAADADYRSDFERAYAEGITAETVKDAVATFERSLVTPDSPFDRFLRGDERALTREQREGWALFQDLGCVTCHQGVNLGGNSFQALSVDGRYFVDRGGEITKADLGRFNVTGLERDRHRFKVPTLRNVALTAPYLHDGTAATLEDAVRVMARYQLGVELMDDEVASVVAFLHSLTGTLRRSR